MSDPNVIRTEITEIIQPIIQDIIVQHIAPVLVEDNVVHTGDNVVHSGDNVVHTS